jgi:glyoxylase-like metal-dependent hydrolase (beta-lactamase superfamily II)
MINVERFVFNPFQVNTYVVSDAETNNCVIVDGGCSNNNELNRLKDYVSDNLLTPSALILTHAHIDHIIGNYDICKTFDIPLYAHNNCEKFLHNSQQYAEMFGLKMNNIKEIDKHLTEDTNISFGNSILKIFDTPGHADGSICLYSPDNGFVITGDVLFYQSIGRTDLETGNYDILQKSIWSKLFNLPDDTVVYPGHGPETRIGYEKVNNPFVSLG